MPEEDVQTILKAGLAAESAMNQQPWYFVAITDQSVMEELAGFGGGASGEDMPAFLQGGDIPAAPSDGEMPDAPDGDVPLSENRGSAKAAMGDSPLAIVIYMDEDTSLTNPSFDCGLAAQNMYIAAASLGYGVKIVASPTMILNGTDHDQICEKLGVDTNLSAIAVLLIGKPDDTVDGISGATERSGINEKATLIG